MWIWILVCLLAVLLFFGRIRESFYVENSLPEGVKYVRIQNNLGLDESLDSVMGWSGGHDNPAHANNDSAISCRNKAAAEPDKYSAWGWRTPAHTAAEWRNSCFLYLRNSFKPFAGDTTDLAHMTGCVNPGEKVSTGCQSVTTANRALQISQLAAFNDASPSVNVAVGRPTTASVHLATGVSSLAVDGTLAARGWPNIYHSLANTGNEFWEVELAQPTTLSRIEFYNRLDCCQERASKYVLILKGIDQKIIATIPFTSASNSMTFYLNKLSGAAAAGAVGPRGVPGEIGPQGIPGAVGPAGVAGPVGTQGIAGPVGPTGTAGPFGLQGEVGPTGSAGEKGIKGDMGQRGISALEEGPDGAYASTNLGSSKYEAETERKFAPRAQT
jgi:hypothetical protein